MDNKIKEMQGRVLNIFSQQAKNFALAGGTALERYYLHHRFSWDLDFFSPKYDLSEIERLVSAFKKQIDKRLKLETELMAAGKAKVRFYSLPVKEASRPLKIDFVEDAIFKTPTVQKKDGVRVYSVENIYLQKIVAISGIRSELDEVGRSFPQERNGAPRAKPGVPSINDPSSPSATPGSSDAERGDIRRSTPKRFPGYNPGSRAKSDEPRDVFDIFNLSTKIQPLHEFLHQVPIPYQKGMVHWYRKFSRQDLKLALLDLDIYDAQFNSREMIAYLETEIKTFAKEVCEK